MQVILTYSDLFRLCSDIIPTSVTPHARCNTDPVRGATVRVHTRPKFHNDFNLMHPVRGATDVAQMKKVSQYLFQSNAPRAGCDSKTIQSKRILVARRMYSFANYVLHILKHLPTYCIGTTLQPLIFGAKLPVILC